MTKKSSPPPRKIHPLLRELLLNTGAASPLLSSPKKGNNNAGAPSAAEILDHLLYEKIVSEEKLRAVYNTLVEEKKANANAAQQQQQQQAKAAAAAAAEVAPPTIRTRHVALDIFYDGEKYSGLAENVGSETDQSIERALFTALQKCQFITNRESAKYSRCGRTDKGVSAAGQVVALHLKSAFTPSTSWDAKGQDLVQDDQLPKNSLDAKTVFVPPRRRKPNVPGGATTRQEKELTEFAYDHVLNNLLPPEIRVLGWTAVSDEFSARFSAGSRTYRYFFCRRSMNIDKMREGLAFMVGTHDFRNLCKLNVEEVSNFERTIHKAEIVALRENDSREDDDPDDDIYRMEIWGQAFLWHQIRCIVSVLFMIGKGQEEPSVVPKLLDVNANPGKPSYPLADERPLVLHNCAYENLYFGYTMRNLWSVTCHQEQRWEDLILAAARIRNSLNKMGASKLLVSDLQQFCQDRIDLRHKKAKKHGQSVPDHCATVPFTTKLITWKEALQWMRRINLIPEPDSARDAYHVPLFERSMGSSYEEKVIALQKNHKRKSRFEENTVSKRSTKKEDRAFYEQMTKQGGSAFDGD